jgi:hypothetical protein
MAIGCNYRKCRSVFRVVAVAAFVIICNACVFTGPKGESNWQLHANEVAFGRQLHAGMTRRQVLRLDDELGSYDDGASWGRIHGMPLTCRRFSGS